MHALSTHEHALVVTAVHAQGLASDPVVPVHVASLPSLFATTSSHVASAPALPVHVPRDSPVQAALLAGLALPEQAGMS